MDADPRWLGSDDAPGWLDDVVQKIADWLLSEPVLRRDRAGAGVVNFLQPDGTWDGLYPEICGYYLQFAACAAASGSRLDEKALRSAAAAVAAWLDGVGGVGAEPLTLYHRDMGESDWRNLCLFAFDLSIILRGLAAAEARWPGLIPSGVIERYSAAVLRILDNGRLDSHRLRDGAAAVAVPVKWSTTQGPLHVKAAAALAGLGCSALTAVAQATLLDETNLFARDGEQRMRELHPFLYAIEGWLTVWGQGTAPEALATARHAFAMVLKQIDPITGELPPVAHAYNAVVRSDVIAQALRAGLVLEAAGQLTAEIGEMWRERRAPLISALRARISDEGGILFDRVGCHRNSWASMFAWQALWFLRQQERHMLNPMRAAAELI